jgi:hypothetical protein
MLKNDFRSQKIHRLYKDRALQHKILVKPLRHTLVPIYFDIETVPTDEYRHYAEAVFDPCKAKIKSIQYQRLDSAAG